MQAFIVEANNMSAGNFEACADFVLRQEGGFSMVRADPGNWTGGRVGSGELKGTNMGIAASTYPNLDIKHLHYSQVAEIYHSQYWDQINGNDLPPGIDLVVFDFAINSGPNVAKKYLQKARSKNQTMDMIIHMISAERLSFLQALRAWSRFGAGWGRRVAECEAAALNMLKMSMECDHVDTHIQKVQRKKNRDQILAGSTVILGMGIAAAGNMYASSYGLWLIFGTAATLLGAVIFGHSVWRQSQRVKVLSKLRNTLSSPDIKPNS